MALDEADLRSRKQQWTRAQILDAAWDLARRDGLAVISLRELAAAVGMRAPSLYHYFPSKNALYDAMYADGMQQFNERLEASRPGRDAVATLRNRARSFVDAAVSDPARYELLFHRPVPGFEPSPSHLAAAMSGLAKTRDIATAAGIKGERAFDLFLATTRGLIAMQIANEPGGTRWTRLVDEAVTMFVANYASPASTSRGPKHG
ncbi:MAG TPA: TetR/AcrR family transcriptional regulator [Jatrophihabitantaceae bacterium]|nr:TetR/AcrR family transcriptional regulator [Jatrophihabitantaceae bacterium]